MVESLCLQTETGSTQTAEEQVTSGETMNGWIQLVYWQMDWLSICLGNSSLLTGSGERKKKSSEEIQKRGQQKRLEVMRVSDHIYTHVRTRCTLSWARHKDTSWTQRCSSCTRSKFLFPWLDERTLWAAWSISQNWSGLAYLSESFTLRGKPHNHQTQRFKKMFMWNFALPCFNFELKRLSTIWNLCFFPPVFLSCLKSLCFVA